MAEGLDRLYNGHIPPLKELLWSQQLLNRSALRNFSNCQRLSLPANILMVKSSRNLCLKANIAYFRPN